MPSRRRTPRRGMIERGRGFYYRRRRGGRDELVFLHTDPALAEIEYHKQWLEDRTGVSLSPPPLPIENPPQPKREHVTVAGAAQRWLDSAVAAHRKPKSVRDARTRVRKYLEEFFRNDLIRDVTAERLELYRVWLGEQQTDTKPRRALSRQSIIHVLSDCRALLRWAAAPGGPRLIDELPIPRKFIPKPPKIKPRFLTDLEVKTLLEKLEGPRLFAVRLGLATGMRWGELCRAEAKHLGADGQLEVWVTKSDQPRKIPLGDIDPELAREISRRVGRLLPYSETSDGTFNRTVKRLSGLKGFQAHQLRHTFATRWLARGGNIVALQQVLGHSDLELTQRYAKATEEFVRAEARKVGSFRAGRNGDETVTKSGAPAQVVALKRGMTVS